MFRQIFGSRLQHPDPEMRRAALAELDTDDPRLGQLALEDAEVQVRVAALTRLTDLETLVAALRRERDEQAREAARRRLIEVLCEAAEGEAALARRTAALEAADDDAVRTAVLLGAADVELRTYLLARVADPAVLARVAAADPAGQLRLAALERVTEERWLEEVARSARNRDKGVARTARERADALREARERGEAAAALCSEVERLAGSALEPADVATFQRLDREWEACERALGEGGAALRERYSASRERIRSRLRHRAELRRRHGEILASLEAAVAALEQADPEAPPPPAVDEEDLRAAWLALGANADLTVDSDRFEGLLETWRAGAERLRADALRAAAAAQWLARHEALVGTAAGAPETVTPTALDPAALRAEWEGLARPADTACAERLEQRFSRLLEAIGGGRGQHDGATEGSPRRRAGAPPSAPRPDGTAIATRVADLSARLDEAAGLVEGGELARAATIVDAVREQTEALASSHGRKAVRRLRERLQALAPKLEELRAWRRWSTGQARERLCAEAEALVGTAPADPAELARGIRRLREEWQKLDRAEGGAPRALWARFNDACSRAYAPCKEHFAAEAARRQENLVAKTALLEALEAHLEGIDFDGQVDWRELDRAFGDFQRRWRPIGAVDRREGKALSSRYERLRAAVSARLAPVRARELERRRADVAALRELAAAEDLRPAAAEAKRAQAGWAPLVRAPRKTEQALWNEFRAVCDDIFERLAQQREAQSQLRDGALEQALAACDAIDALAGELASLGFGEAATARETALQADFSAEQARFDAAGTLPRARADEVRSRYRGACARFEDARRERRRSRQAHRLDGLAARAAIAAALEQAVLAGTPDALAAAVADAETRWASLEPVQDPGLDAVTTRWRRALAAGGGDAGVAAALRGDVDTARAEREALCLQLEVATGIDSPPQWQERRMALQIERLQASLRGTGERDGGRAEVEALLRRWFALGPATGEEGDAALEARVARARAAAGGAGRARAGG